MQEAWFEAALPTAPEANWSTLAREHGLGPLGSTQGPNDAIVDNPPIMFAFALDGTAQLPTPAPPVTNNPPQPPNPATEH